MGTDEIRRPSTHFDVDKNTYVRLGAVIAVLLVFGSAWNWLDGRFKALEHNMDEAARRIEAASNDRWTRTDQRLLMLELQVRNPKLVVPPVEAAKR